MAESSKNSAYQDEEERKNNPFIVFFSNFLSAIKLPFPPKEKGPKSEPDVTSSQADEPVLEDDISRPNFVKFPRRDIATIKLEANADEAERSTNPMLLWQVYAIGGILFVRWAWKRWNEMKGQKKTDDEPPPSHD